MERRNKKINDLLINGTSEQKNEAKQKLFSLDIDGIRNYNFERISEILKITASRNVELTVFPELALTSFFPYFWIDDKNFLKNFYEKNNVWNEKIYNIAKDLKVAVAYLDENGDFHNANHDPDMKWLPWELDTLMFPDRKFMPSDPFESQGRMETNMVGSRGCPFHCRFCAGARELLIGGVRKRSVTNILQEFQMLNEQGITAVRLIDDLFLADKKRMKEFFDGMISSGLGEKMVWDATARVNTLSKMPWELLEMMSKSGLREVSIGVESASPRILKLLDKDTTPDMVVQTVKNLSQVGVRTKGYFILGSPSETEEEMEQTVGFMHSLRELAWNVVVNNPRSPNGTENNAQFRGSMFEFRPYPGTRLYHMITGQYPWPEDVIWPNGQRPKYTEDEILAGFQPVLMEGLEERQKHNYTTNLELSAVSPAMIQERLKDAMMEQRDKIRSMGGYIPGVNLNGQRNKEIETG